MERREELNLINWYYPHAQMVCAWGKGVIPPVRGRIFLLFVPVLLAVRCLCSFLAVLDGLGHRRLRNIRSSVFSCSLGSATGYSTVKEHKLIGRNKVAFQMTFMPAGLNGYAVHLCLQSPGRRQFIRQKSVNDRGMCRRVMIRTFCVFAIGLPCRPCQRSRQLQELQTWPLRRVQFIGP